jgi:signal transduction histidine kinase
MQQLVDDLLDMASIQAGRFSIETQVLHLASVLDESGQSHEPMARVKGVRLETDVAHCDITVLGDRARLLQVLGNLVGNAIKFSKSGDSVMIRGETRDGEALISVSDTGPGIPRERFDDIFEPYQTVQTQGNRGTGLGLFIAKGIVERHGGRIWLESEIGTGTTFFFTLPLSVKA